MDLAKIIVAVRRALTSSHIMHMEREIEALRGQNNMLLTQLTALLTPRPAPTVERKFPILTPQLTSWEAYRAAEMARQEAEDKDGIQSSGR